MADQNLCFHRFWLGSLGGVQTAVYADYSSKLETASREFEHDHAAKTVADRCKPSIDQCLRCQHCQPRSPPSRHCFGVSAQFRNLGKHALAITGNAVAVHIASKYNEAAPRQQSGAPFGVVI